MAISSKYVRTRSDIHYDLSILAAKKKTTRSDLVNQALEEFIRLENRILERDAAAAAELTTSAGAAA